MTLESFFHGVPSGDQAKFDKLAKVLKEQLTGVKVYKVGDEVEKNVYIIGKTEDNRWAGLRGLRMEFTWELREGTIIVHLKGSLDHSTVEMVDKQNQDQQ
jgi:hypothetical protein